jgi:hypothetical protein
MLDHHQEAVAVRRCLHMEAGQEVGNIFLTSHQERNLITEVESSCPTIPYERSLPIVEVGNVFLTIPQALNMKSPTVAAGNTSRGILTVHQVANIVMTRIAHLVMPHTDRQAVKTSHLVQTTRDVRYQIEASMTNSKLMMIKAVRCFKLYKRHLIHDRTLD